MATASSPRQVALVFRYLEKLEEKKQYQHDLCMSNILYVTSRSQHKFKAGFQQVQTKKLGQ